jgi:MinD-like ATPase involved in chromosome partitioning or flagellar assembly
VTTGRHEEPEVWSEAQWFPPGQESQAPPSGSQNTGSQNTGPQQVGHQNPGPQNPGPQNGTSQEAGPQQAGPHNAGPQNGTSQEARPAQAEPQQVDYSSGQQPVDYGPGPYGVEPHPSGPHPVEQQPRVPPYLSDQQLSGPHPVEQHPSALRRADQRPYQQGPPHLLGQPPSPYHPQSPALYGGPHAPHESMAAGHDLSSAQLLRQTKRPPQSGWRRAVYMITGRTVNLGESPADQIRRELIARINQPLHGCYKIAMLSLKGGVGKTTTTTALGSTFASLRGDRVIAVDANPDRGTLSQKIPLETTATVRHLLRDAQRIRRYSDVRSYTSQGPSRLEVLASEQDPAVSEAFSEDDYRRTVNLLEHFYNIVLTDCGTGLMHSAMKGVLNLADSLVIVSSGSIDGARSASATLDWLDAHGYRALVARSVAVINSVRPKAGKVDLNKVADHFAARCRAVCRIPFDPHLEEGAELELDQLTGTTRLALLELAATVADDFPQAVNRARAR